MQTAHLQPVAELPDLIEARRVLTSEAKALELMGHHLDNSFIRALDILQAVEGRVVVSGMGKSGHIGRKIAATLASTGTPAMFVHPAEASHGDLGMIEKKDAVIALSNSGETTELASILKYCKRFNIPLIGITSRRDSTLGIASNATIVLPLVPEACPIGLAPMTSTTLMMALGDALAAALLCRKQFSTTDFGIYHPGGSLGLKLQKVSDLMHTGDRLPLISMATPMSDALVIMTQKSFGCVGVCNNQGQVIGIITDGDLRRHMGMDILHSDVATIMTPTPMFINPDAMIAEAVRILNEKKITSLFVAHGTPGEPFTPMGIIHIHDCLRAGQ